MSKVKGANLDEGSESAFYKSLDIHAGSPSFVKQFIEFNLERDMPTGIFGRAGIGKTQILKQIAQERDMELITIYLAHIEREDLSGFPFQDPSDENRVVMKLRSIFPSKKSSRKGGTLVFFDEFNRGERPVLNAAFTAMEKPRRLGDLVLPDDVRIVLAGNPSDAQYMVNEAEKEPAIRRRVDWVGMILSNPGFLQYGTQQGFHPSVLSYIRKNKGTLYDTEAHNAGKVAACPASWEKVSDAVKHAEKRQGGLEKNAGLLRAIIGGHIGMRVAGEFMSELTNSDLESIDPDDILFKDFVPGSETYERVLKMVNAKTIGGSGKMGDLCSNLAISIAATKPAPITIAANLATFLNMLEADNFQAFHESLTAKMKESDEGAKYMPLLSSTLGKQPDYQGARSRLTKKMAELDKKLSK